MAINNEIGYTVMISAIIGIVGLREMGILLPINVTGAPSRNKSYNKNRNSQQNAGIVPRTVVAKSSCTAIRTPVSDPL